MALEKSHRVRKWPGQQPEAIIEGPVVSSVLSRAAQMTRPSDDTITATVKDPGDKV